MADLAFEAREFKAGELLRDLQAALGFWAADKAYRQGFDNLSDRRFDDGEAFPGRRGRIRKTPALRLTFASPSPNLPPSESQGRSN